MSKKLPDIHLITKDGERTERSSTPLDRFEHPAGSPAKGERPTQPTPEGEALVALHCRVLEESGSNIEELLAGVPSEISRALRVMIHANRVAYAFLWSEGVVTETAERHLDGRRMNHARQKAPERDAIDDAIDEVCGDSTPATGLTKFAGKKREAINNRLATLKIDPLSQDAIRKRLERRNKSGRAT